MSKFCGVHSLPEYYESNLGIGGKVIPKGQIEDVLIKLSALQAEDDLRIFNPRRPLQIGEGGYIYLVECGEKYKIGTTRNLDKRIKVFSTEYAFKPVLLHSIYSPTPYESEESFHNDYAEYRLNGEWFDLPKGDVEFICGLPDGAL
jgi:hypothetical protein